MIVAGIGCRRGVPAEELEKVVHMALDRFELQAARLDAIATEAGKAAEPAFAELSRRLSTRLEACTIEELDRVANQVPTPSVRALEAKGVPSIAEASALVVAGRNARLLGTRIATAQATCAIAVGDGR